MGIFDNVLLLSDFDGTLTGSSGCLVQRNLDAVRYFIAEGGRFSVSTGRTKIGFHKYSPEYINAPVILGNGAMAFDYEKGEAVFVNAITEKNIPVLNRIIADNPWICMELYSVDDTAYVININPASKRHFENLGIDSYRAITELTSEMFPMVKIMLSAGERSEEIQNYLRSIPLGEMKFIPCAGSFVEILAQSAGKGNALYQAADYLLIDRKNAFAVGDGSNDVDMIETASVGFVPSSGDRIALNIADVIVCSSDEGAVADVVYYLADKFN